MTITPDQAREWRDNARPGPWYVHTDPDDPDGTFIYDEDGHMCIAVAPDGSDYREADLTLAAAAPDLAQTIAGMTEQWKAEYREIWGAWLAVSDWTTEDKARLALTPDQFKDATTRLVRRLVGPVEATE